MASVLFICTGNMYRSPIAAEAFRGLLAHHGQLNYWQVGSAGTWTTDGRSAPNDAIEIARSFGVNIEGHRTRIVNQKILRDADLILTMEEGHKEALQVEFPFAHEKIRLLAQVARGFAYDIPDPISAHGETKAIIQELINMIRIGYENIYNAATFKAGG